jgi:hypothetical protein
MPGRLEQAVTDYYAPQPIQALVSGSTPRAVMTANEPPPVVVHTAKTDAPCSVCGAHSTQLLRRGLKGPFTTACSKSTCVDTAIKNL